jgi:ribosomal protein L7/L12
MSVTVSGHGPALVRVVELVRAGKTIAAIQEYRSLTGAELAEAKAAVNPFGEQT